MELIQFSAVGLIIVLPFPHLLQFSKTFLLEYRFEEIQALKFVVLDVDDTKHIDDVGRHDLIGEIECSLADIVTAGQQYKRTLREKGTWFDKTSLLTFVYESPLSFGHYR